MSRALSDKGTEAIEYFQNNGRLCGKSGIVAHKSNLSIADLPFLNLPAVVLTAKHEGQGFMLS